MLIQENSVFRRLHAHAQKRLVFDPGVPRGQQLPAYKRYIELENEMLKRLHKKSASGLKVCQARTAMVDVVLENLFLAALDLFTTKHGPIPGKMSLLATGGYGRRELNPHSDIDILFLYPEKISGKNFALFQSVLTEEILYPLWDFGWKIGHASRNTKEVIQEARKEIQSKNAILESRLICGSVSLHKRMQKQFSDYYQTEDSTAYIQQRLLDEQQRHKKFGNTVYLQEPDIKNGVGGLRDYQNILWMTNIKFGFSSFREINKAKLLRRHLCIEMEAAYDLLLRTRTELHLQNRSSSNKLDLEQQTTVALGLGYEQPDIFERVEAFMQNYYNAARTIYQISEILKERLALSSETDPRSSADAPSFRKLSAQQKSQLRRIDGFILQDKMLFHETKTVFNRDPLRLIRIFRLIQQYGAKLHPDLKFRISRSLPLIDHTVINNPSAAKSFCSILSSPGEVFPALKLMHELGVLGRYLPEFGQLTCKVQHEYYHRYTADEHVLRTIGQLDKIFQQGTAVSITYEKELRKNDNPLLLYLMLLLHDIGKAEGIKEHDVNGVRIAKPILDRFEISEKQQGQVLFVIRNHLEMTRIWRRFDLDDPETMRSFAETVEDTEKLRFLYVHTYCDARGTAPSLWSDHKEMMHKTLFNRTLEQLVNTETTEQKRRERKDTLLERMFGQLTEGITQEEIRAHFDLLPERYFTNTSIQNIELHIRMANQFMGQNRETQSVEALAPIIDWQNDIDLNITVVHVVTWNRAGLFYKLAGALTLAGVNITSTKAFSREDHISIDTFYIMDSEGGIVTNPTAYKTFKAHCEESLIYGKRLTGEVERLEATVKSQKKPTEEMLPAPLTNKIKVYYEPSLDQKIVEITTNDRIGLLYQIARQIYANRFDIIFARISTERGIAMDTFYIERIDSLKSTSDKELSELSSKIKNVIDG
jgi:[protein-PII] uridylyltransferase